MLVLIDRIILRKIKKKEMGVDDEPPLREGQKLYGK